jgi:hypothetical protein
VIYRDNLITYIGQEGRMLRLFRTFCIFQSLLLIFLSSTVLAGTWVEATGQSLLVNGDVKAARARAIDSAKEQALLQVAAYVSTTQEIENGVLSRDELSVASLGVVKQVEVVDETLKGDYLWVRIKAEVIPESMCPSGNAPNNLKKTVAFTAFAMTDPSQTNLGALSQIQSRLATVFTERSREARGIRALNAGQYQMFADPETASTLRLNTGALTQTLSHTSSLDVQYIVSGVIRDLSMTSPQALRETDWLKDTYNKLDYKSDKHQRHFVVDLFVHDAFSGGLVYQNQYHTQGKWPLDQSFRTGFDTPAFYKTGYGKAVSTLIDTMRDDIVSELKCQPFMASIDKAMNDQIWINAGQNSGLKSGDTLTVYRKNIYFNPTAEPTTELIATPLTLTIDVVQTMSAHGTVNGHVTEYNIQSDDLVIVQ